MNLPDRDSLENNSNPKPPGVRECLRALATPIQYLKGVGPKRAGQLVSLGLKTVGDLLYHLPFRYEDRREIAKISQAVLGREASFVGLVPRTVLSSQWAYPGTDALGARQSGAQYARAPSTGSPGL
jgi:hypothetical protein